MDGTIKALFYRYKSVGGYDYVSDFLISPEKSEHQTHPGDSGTLWHLAIKEELAEDGAEQKLEKTKLRPLALEWGGQGLLPADGGTTANFTLATSLTTVCRWLDVELDQGLNAGAQPFWGTTGHYSIAEMAIGKVPTGKLKTFLDDNSSLISFDLQNLKDGKIAERLHGAKYIPLADVPDLVWKKLPDVVTGGRDIQKNTGPGAPESLRGCRPTSGRQGGHSTQAVPRRAGEECDGGSLAGILHREWSKRLPVARALALSRLADSAVGKSASR